MVKRFSRDAFYCLLPLLAIAAATAGCRPAVDSGDSVGRSKRQPSVTSPSVTAMPPPAPSVTAPLAAGQPPPPANEEVIAALVNMVRIEIELPAPAFRGTPVPLEEPNVEKPRGEPRPPFFAPEGTVNLARGKPVAASDPMPTAGELDYVTDGMKEASDFGYLELHPGTQWVQIDLGQQAAVYGVVIWHNHADARVYRDVVVQVSDDPDFLTAETVFNNDYDNTSGLGIGGHLGYVETSEGKLVEGLGVEGRYVRVYGKGSHVDPKNHYTEVEVFGKPVK